MHFIFLVDIFLPGHWDAITDLISIQAQKEDIFTLESNLDNLYSNRNFEVVFCIGDQTLIQCGRLLKDLHTAKSNCELVN